MSGRSGSSQAFCTGQTAVVISDKQGPHDEISWRTMENIWPMKGFAQAAMKKKRQEP